MPLLIRIAIIVCVAGLIYWAVNRAPVMAPTIKQIIKILDVVVACLLILAAVTGWQFPH